MTAPGCLYLIPSPIGEQDPLRVLSPESVDTIRSLRYFVVESERTAGRFLSRVLSRDSLEASSFSVLDEHTLPEDVPRLLDRVLDGEDAGLISEAGCPCVADPGADLVAEAHRRGVRVAPLAGPSSLLLALMSSGFNGQKFLFLGYIPSRGDLRGAALKNIERDCLRDGVTRIFIETPYRNRAVLDDALRVLDGDTRLCVAASLGGPSERVRSGTVSSWRKGSFSLGKEPAVFLLSAGPSCAGKPVRAEKSGPDAFSGKKTERPRRRSRPGCKRRGGTSGA